MAIKVRVFPGSASCTECGYMLRFEPIERGADHCIGECFTCDCANYEKPFKFPASFVECEELNG